MKTIVRVSTLALLAVAATSAFGYSINFSALSSFGGGDGWLSNGEHPGLANDNNARGMAYNRKSGNLLFASRTGAPNIHIIDPLTGASKGTLNMTGVTGGTFAINMISVDDDGRIYGGNLTTNSTSSPYKIYRWDDESSAPVVVYQGSPLAGARLGDTLDAIGGGSNVRLVSGYNSSPSVAGNNSYAVFTQNGSGNLDAAHIAFTGTPPNAGDHRVGITFTDADHVYGTPGAAVARYSSYDLATGTGTLVGTSPLTAGGERPVDYVTIGGLKMLITIDSGSSAAPNDGVCVVRVYDATNPTSLSILGSARNMLTSQLVTNTNATGAVTVSEIVGNKARVYALGTNNGIQAFELEVVPEPATFAVLGLGLAALARRRKAR